ncbi:protein kinase [Thermopolyspora flexuosa]|nr:serine/threonine-protein kinase [Thermopolyspora flexuosa]GGM91911.1 protein kinase [Thermopolyspora flexuosa]
MGEVWFGYDKRLDRPIAIKFIRIDRLSDGRADDELTRRFVRESRITARMNHPGVPVVYDCGTHEDKLYLVMQQIEGCSVSDLIAEVEPLPVPWAAAIAAQVCSVLAAAHANSLVHRDLKPSNLMICPDGSVKVLDFGVAAALTPDATKITATGTAIGTPEYMAPEQALSGTTSPQSDLYSLGVVLDEMLTGRNQFSAPTPLASMRRHLDAPPTPPRKRRPDVPEELERLVLWLLEKTPDRRPPDAATVYDHLVGFCRELPPLPGFVDQSRRSPARMYTSVLPPLAASGRSAVETPPPPRPVPPRSRTAEPTTPTPSIGRTDIELAMQEAKDLKGEARFSQAAEVLARVVEPATRAFGAHDAGVIDLRIEYADVLFLGGDYRRAAPEFRRLAEDLAEREGPDDSLVLRFRLMEANCHAAAGETSLALTQLTGLLEDEKRYGVDEDRILELRRQIGLLQLGSGDRAGAARTFRELLPDLERRSGPDNPNLHRVKEILDGLEGEG